MIDCHHSFKFINMLCKPIQNFVLAKRDFKISKWQINKMLMLAGDVFLAWKLSLVFKRSALYPANRPHTPPNLHSAHVCNLHMCKIGLRGGREVVISSTVHPSCSREGGVHISPSESPRSESTCFIARGKKGVGQICDIFSRFLSGPVQWRHLEER